MNSYTLADLTNLTGAKRRTVQLWAEAGVILADPETERAGTGTHRRFSRQEAVIALIINPMARMQVSIGELLGIARDVRRFLVGGEVVAVQEEIQITLTDGDVRHNFWPAIEQCIAGERQMYLVITRFRDHRSSTLYATDMDHDAPTVAVELSEHIMQHEAKEGAIAIVIPLEAHLRPLR